MGVLSKVFGKGKPSEEYERLLAEYEAAEAQKPQVENPDWKPLHVSDTDINNRARNISGYLPDGTFDAIIDGAKKRGIHPVDYMDELIQLGLLYESVNGSGSE